MKKKILYCLTLLAVLCSNAAFAQWSSSNIQKFKLTGVQALSQDTVFATGYYLPGDGFFLSTTDGFQTMDTVFVNLGPPKGLFFFDALEGVAWSKWDFAKTTDGGQTWNYQQPNPFPGGPIGDLCHLAGDTIFILYDSGDLLYSPDRGDNWVSSTPSPICNDCKIQFFDAQLGYAAGRDGQNNPALLKPDSSGWFWVSMVPVGPGNGLGHTAMEFLNPDTGFVGSQQGQVLRTFDAGQSWDTLRMGIPGEKPIIDLKIHDNGTVYALADSTPDFLKSTDWGQTWISYEYLCPTYPQAFDFLDAEHGFMVGFDGSFAALDSNQLERKGMEMFGYFGDIHFVLDRKGVMAVHDRNRAVSAYTSNGGSDWEYICTDMLRINEYDFVDTLNGVLVGDSSKAVLFTQDGGLNWMDADVPQPRFDLTDVHFGSGTVGYAIGNEKVLKSTNAGTNWQRVADLPNVAQSTDVFFTDANTGFVTAELISPANTSAILRSSDGGQSWNQQFSYTFADSTRKLVSVYFPDNQTGYAIDKAKLFKSVDGGITWNEVFLNYPPFGSGPFTELYFTSTDTGYLANGFGVMYTSDGGQNWTSQFSVPIGLGQISIPSPNKGYMGGFEWLFYSTNLNFVNVDDSQEESGNLLVYPQPAQNKLRIQIELFDAAPISFHLWSMMGQKVAESSSQDQMGLFTTEMDVSALPAGLYFVEVSQGSWKKTRSVLISR